MWRMTPRSIRALAASAVAVSALLAGCSSGGESTPDASGEFVRMWVEPDLVECTGVGPMECLQVAYTEGGEPELFYDAIDGSGYYRNPVARNCRSWMNVPFTIPNPELEKTFVAEAARALVETRNRWLNPEDLVETVPEVVPGFPDRILPRNAAAAQALKARTLTKLYNTRGTPEGAWLDGLHQRLDEAVAAAYGWPADITKDDALAALLALNHARPAAG